MAITSTSTSPSKQQPSTLAPSTLATNPMTKTTNKKGISTLHAALKLVARAVDQLQVHHFTNMRKVLTELGPHIRLGASDMVALKQRVACLGTSYCELEKYLTRWALAGKDGIAEAQHRAVITEAEAMRDAVLAARADLVELLDRVRREQPDVLGEADMEKQELGRYMVHFKYYAALMQHMRFKGISWFGDTVVSNYLRAEAATNEQQEAHTAQGGMIDISDLCCWVSDMLRGDAATHQRTSKTRTAMQHEIGGRFGVDDEDAGNNLFGWLVRMQRGGSQTPHGVLLDATSIQAPGRGESVCPAVTRYVYAQLGGTTGALAWLHDAATLGFDTSAGHSSHSRSSSTVSLGSGSPSRSVSGRSSVASSAASSPDVGGRGSTGTEYLECLARSQQAEIALRVREQAILLHVVYDGKRALPVYEGVEGGLADEELTTEELEGAMQLPASLLSRCVATARRVVKHYLAHELPAKYQH